MNDPLVSIVTPSYNQREYIEDCILSVKNQPIDDMEHIIIDGGSSDGTLELIQEYEDQNHLQWVSEPDRGQSHALNKGLSLANGEWIGWQNSDDFYLDNAFKVISETQNNYPGVELIYGDLIIVDESGKEIDRKFVTRPSKFIERHWSLFASNQSTFIRKSVFDRVGNFKESLEYAMDADIFWRVLNNDVSVQRVKTALGAYRVHSNAKTFEEEIPKQSEELDTIYPNRRYEIIIPETILSNFALLNKALNLIKDKRTDAIKYNINNR